MSIYGVCAKLDSELIKQARRKQERVPNPLFQKEVTGGRMHDKFQDRNWMGIVPIGTVSKVHTNERLEMAHEIKRYTSDIATLGIPAGIGLTIAGMVTGAHLLPWALGSVAIGTGVPLLLNGLFTFADKMIAKNKQKALSPKQDTDGRAALHTALHNNKTADVAKYVEIFNNFTADKGRDFNAFNTFSAAETVPGTNIRQTGAVITDFPKTLTYTQAIEANGIQQLDRVYRTAKNLDDTDGLITIEETEMRRIREAVEAATPANAANVLQTQLQAARIRALGATPEARQRRVSTFCQEMNSQLPQDLSNNIAQRAAATGIPAVTRDDATENRNKLIAYAKEQGADTTALEEVATHIGAAGNEHKFKREFLKVTGQTPSEEGKTNWRRIRQGLTADQANEENNTKFTNLLDKINSERKETAFGKALNQFKFLHSDGGKVLQKVMGLVEKETKAYLSTVANKTVPKDENERKKFKIERETAIKTIYRKHLARLMAAGSPALVYGFIDYCKTSGHMREAMYEAERIAGRALLDTPDI